MCGIAGIINTNGEPVRRGVIEAMTSCLAHRGPDGYGIELRGPVALGHRRLSIIDPVSGRQPMFNEDGQVCVTFNGEIYNYRELRSLLQGRGHRFASNSDTETIVHAYEEWGDRCVEQFRGMFAFGIMDWRNGRLLLARDQFGIKPLYYFNEGGHFAFASELQALRLLPGIEWRLDLPAIDQYLWLQYIPAPRTAFEQVRKLPPAHRMSVTMDGKVEAPREYWRISFDPDYRPTQDEWQEELDATLQESVRAHLVSDVPFGAFLSGGVDSSLVVAYMSRELNATVKAFSIGFEEEEFNELPYARFAAEQWGVEHHYEVVRPDALGILPQLVRHYGDLFGDSSAVPTYYVSQLARQTVPMVLSGDGADESFAGYWSHGNWVTAFTSNPSKQPTLGDWLAQINYIPIPQRLALWRPEYAGACPAPLELFAEAFARTAPFSLCQKAQYMDLKTYLPYDILTKVDTASMMHGLEVRTPFVDTRVVELAARIPEQFNMVRSPGGEWERKSLLKRTALRYYPPEFVYRPKMGFAIPIASWFSPGGRYREELVERLLGPSSTLASLFLRSGIEQLLGQAAPGPLWLLLYLEEWLRQNVASPATAAVTPEIAGDQTLQRPTVPREETSQDSVSSGGEAGRLRVLMIYDVEGWAWWNRARNIAGNCKPGISAELLRMGLPFDHRAYDFIVIFDPYLISHLADTPPEKIIVGCSCPEYLGQTVELLSRALCAAGFVNNRTMFEMARHVVPNLFCCQNGVDEELFRPSGTVPSAVIACWVGNADSIGNKGLDLIREACRRSGIHLVTLDREANRDKGSLMSQEGVRDTVYYRATCYICASEQEGTPNPALEALACGLPVISTRVGNMPELIRDGYNGYLVDRSAAAIGEAIERLKGDDLATMSRNARQSILEGWTWRQQAAKYDAMFEGARASGARYLELNRLILGGRIAMERSDYRSASSSFRRALDLDPANRNVRYSFILAEKLRAGSNLAS